MAVIKVKLVAHTQNVEQLVAAAYKVCYSSDTVEDIIDQLTPDKAEDFLGKVLEFGHESPVEHASFTFAIEGVSRALMAQLTRHRIASFSVRSQRYVSQSRFDYVTPPEIAACPEALAVFEEAMANAAEAYERLSDILTARHQAQMLADGAKPSQAKKDAAKLGGEDARFVLPNACQTQMLATFNIRSLYNLFRLRCCNRAQWEVRDLAWQMLELCKKEAPMLFAKAGPACLHGQCSEGKMTCGRAAQVRAEHL